MEFRALDTETLNRKGGGYALWLGWWSGAGVDEIIFPESFRQIFLALAGQKYVAWNADFDIRALIHPHFLPRKLCEQIGLIGWARADGYEFEFIPHKFLKVRRLSDNLKFEIFDLMQFFDLSLDAASEKFLNGKKIEIPKSWYNEIDRCLRDSRREKVLAYARRDVSLTQRHLENMLESYSGIGLEPKSLYSAGYLARQYFRDSLAGERLPDTMNEIWRRSFFGGRVEVGKMGYLGDISLFDIRSAYPSVIKSLATTNGSRLESGPDWRDRGPCYGSYHVEVEIPRSWNWGPFPYRPKVGPLFYPVGNFDAYIARPGLEFLRESRIPYKVLHALEIFPQNWNPKFAKIQTLFEIRKDPRFSLAAKKTANSLYGKTAEKGRLAEKLAQIAAGRKFGRFRPDKFGRSANFAWAAHITESVRIRVFKEKLRLGKGVFSSATDGLFCAPSVKLPETSKLGGWERKTLSAFVILGCGRYIWASGGKLTGKLRGAPLSEEGISRMMEYRGLDFPLKYLHTDTMRTWADHENEDLNVLELTEKVFRIQDDKRIWDSQFTQFRHAFTRSIDSGPRIGV